MIGDRGQSRREYCLFHLTTNFKKKHDINISDFTILLLENAVLNSYRLDFTYS